MRVIGFMLLSCLLLSIARTIVMALMVALAIAVLWGAYFRPRETVGALFVLVFLNVAHGYPGWTLLAIAGLAVVGIIMRKSDAVQATTRHPHSTKPRGPV